MAKGNPWHDRRGSFCSGPPAADVSRVDSVMVEDSKPEPN